MEIADIERLIKRAETEPWTPALRQELARASRVCGVVISRWDNCGDLAEGLEMAVAEARANASNQQRRP